MPPKKDEKFIISLPIPFNPFIPDRPKLTVSWMEIRLVQPPSNPIQDFGTTPALQIQQYPRVDLFNPLNLIDLEEKFPLYIR